MYDQFFRYKKSFGDSEVEAIYTGITKRQEIEKQYWYSTCVQL